MLKNLSKLAKSLRGLPKVTQWLILAIAAVIILNWLTMQWFVLLMVI